MTSLLLGEFHDSESLNIENKAVHIYSHFLDNISEDDIYDIVKTGKWTSEFNLIMENNLLEFLSNKIPKYIASYANAKENGVVNIGVDDSSEITGFASLTKIPESQILECLTKTISENLKSDNLKGDILVEKILECLKLEYIELETNVNILTDEGEYYLDNFSKDIIEYNDKMDQYLIDHALFLIELRKYSQKLELMLNTRRYRNELAYFIESLSDSSDDLINALKSDAFIKSKRDNIYDDRDNKDRIFYWLSNFRKMKRAQIYKTKPLKPLHPSIYYPKQILANLPSLRVKFIKNNPSLKYYMIKIYCNVSKLDSEIEYRDNYSNKWLFRTRIETEYSSGPSSV